MPIFKVLLHDTVTYSRDLILEIEAEDEDAAQERALSDADNLMSEFSDQLIEDQIDNTPYETAIDNTLLTGVRAEMLWDYPWPDLPEQTFTVPLAAVATDSLCAKVEIKARTAGEAKRIALDRIARGDLDIDWQHGSYSGSPEHIGACEPYVEQGSD